MAEPKNPWLFGETAQQPAGPPVTDPATARRSIWLTGQTGEQVITDADRALAEKIAAEKARVETMKDAPRVEAWRQRSDQNRTVSHDDGEHLGWLETTLKTLEGLTDPMGTRATADVVAGAIRHPGDALKAVGDTLSEVPRFGAYLKQGSQDVERLELRYQREYGGGLNEAQAQRLRTLEEANRIQSTFGLGPKNPVGEAVRASPMTGSILVQALPSGIAGATGGGLAGAGGGTAVAPGPGTAVGFRAGATAGFELGMTAGSVGPSFKLNVASVDEELAGFVAEDGTTLSPGERKTTALAAGAIITALDSFGLNRIMKASGITPAGINRPAIMRLLQKRETRAAVGEVVRRYGEGALVEGSTEALQELVQILFGEGAKAASGKDFESPTLAQQGERVKGAGIVGGLVGGATTTPFMAADLFRLEQQEARAKARGKVLEAIAAGPESKLRAELPEKYQDLVAAVTQGGPVENVYITAEPLMELFQSQGVDPAEALKALGLPETALDEALRQGGELKVPMGTYLSQIVGTELDAATQPHIKFRPGDEEMTLSEAEEFRKNYPDLVKAMDEEAAGGLEMADARRADRQRLRGLIEEQIGKDKGFTREQVAGQADMRVEWYEAVMRAQGLTLDEALAAYPIEQVRSAYETPQQRVQPPAAPVDLTTYEGATRHRESRGKLNARASTSTALGPHQFVDSTWVGVIRRHGLPGMPNAKEIAAGIRMKDGRVIVETEDQRKLMALRTNDAASTAAFYALTEENRVALVKGIGREPTAGELFIAHFAGSGGAVKLLNADPNAIAAEVLPAAARSNGTIFYEGRGAKRRARTVAEVVAELTKDHGGATYTPPLPEELPAVVDMPERPKVDTAGGQVLDQFAGRGALTADFGKLRTAQLMELRDSTPVEVWEATGWMRGVDGRWRFEIDDSSARLVEGATDKLRMEADRRRAQEWADLDPEFLNEPELGVLANKPLTLGDVLDHDGLFAAYPKMREVPVFLGGPPGARGSFAPEAGEIGLGWSMVNLPDQAVSTLLHEVQHLIQTVEGFAVGANTDRGQMERMGYRRALQQVTDEMVAEYPPASRAAARERIEQMAHAVRETYRRSEGEVEARNVQARQFMTEEERRDLPPDFTRDVPREKAALAFSEGRDERRLKARYLDVEASKTLYQSDALYSALGRAIEQSTQERASPDQWIATLKKTPGIKAEELQWSGVLDYLEGRKTTPAPGYERTTPVTRDELLTFVTANGVAVEVVELSPGGDWLTRDERERLLYAARDEEVDRLLAQGYDVDEAIAEAADNIDPEEVFDRARKNRTQFESYKLPGADDTYRELLFRLPNIKGPTTHWEQDNVVAHARTTIRQDADGNRVLFVEEVQSDWHQKGRDQGYRRAYTDEEIAELRENYDVASALWREAARDVIELANPVMAANSRRAKELVYAVHPRGEDDFGGLPLTEQVSVAKRALIELGEGAQVELPGGVIAVERQAALRLNETRQAFQSAQRGDGIPDAPFRTGWPALVMKRLIRYAVDEELDRIAWTTGDQIGPVVGANSPEQRAGLNAFYGRNLVNIVNDLTKKYGAKVVELRVHLAPMPYWQEPLYAESLTTPTRPIHEVADEIGRYETRALAAELEGRDDEAAAIRQELAGRPELEAERKRASAAYDWQKAYPTQPGIIITPELADAARGGFALFQRQEIGQGENDIARRPVRRGAIYLPRGIGGFQAGDQMVVDLFAGRDLSTLLHETSGHYTLEQLIHLIRTGVATPETRATVDALLLWFNVPTVDDIGVREHEMFAEAVEQYIYEGRAPSLRLRKLFATYRAWMVGIYGRAKGVRADVTDEVRTVFDRLLAGQEEIDAARAAAKLEPLFSDAELATMDPAVAAAYRQVVASARRDAEDDMDRELMSALVREQRAWYQAEKTRVREEVEAEVVARPEYRAFEWLAHGAWLGDQPKPEWLGDPVKLSREALEAEYGKGILRSLKMGAGFARVYADGGVHPDAIAEALGFESGRELVDALTLIEPRTRAVNAETDARMLAEYGDPMVDGTAPAVADAALHNVNQQRALELELQQLQGRPAMRGMREAAERQIARSKVSEVEAAERHLASERKAANAAQRAFRKGDLAEAARQKFRQLVAFHTYSASRRAQVEIEKANRLFDRVVNGRLEATARSRNMDLVMAARAILAAHGIGRSDGPAQSYIAAVAQYDPELFDTLGPEIAAAIDGAVGDTRALSVEDLMALRSVVGSLWARARADKVIEIDGKRIELEQARSEITDQLDTQTPLSRAEGTAAISDGEKLLLGFSGLRACLRRVESWARRVDNGVGPVTRYIWRPVSEGADAHRVYSGRLRRAYADLMAGIAPSITWGKIGAPELRHTFANKAELLHAILHTGNESNKRKLLLGGQGGQPWAEEAEDGSLNTASWDGFVSRMIREGVLTQADYDFAQAVWDLLETTKPEAQRVHRQVFGRYFEEVTANAFSTPWGVYRGGYVPASVNTQLVQEGAVRAEAERIEGGGGYMFPAPARGFTKSRVENYTRPLALDLRLLAQHLDKVSLFVNLSVPVRDALRLLKSRDVGDALMRFDPAAMTDMLLPWLQRSAKQVVSTPIAGRGGALVDSFARELRSRTGLNTMFANLTNALQQFTGWSLSLVNVKGTHMGRALALYMRAPSAMAEAARQASPFMADRLDNQSVEAAQDLADMLNRPTMFGQTKAFITRHGYFLQHAFQNIVDLTTWTGAHFQALAEGHDSREAVRRADAAVRLTQGSLNPEDVSRFETGNTIQRLFTQFASYFNMQANLLTTEVGMAARGGRPARVMWAVLMGFTVPALLADAIKRGMTGGFEDDDDDGYLDVWFDWLFMSQLRGGLAMVPVAGPWANTAMNMFNDKPYDDRLSLSPGVGALDAAARTPVNVYRLATGEGDWSRTAKDTLTLLGLATGIPLGALGRPVGYGLDVAEGDVEPTDPVDAVRGAVTGAPSPASRE